MTQEPTNQTKREEIDLFQIASKGKDMVVGFGKTIGQFISFSFLLLLRYYYLTLSALILGLGIGFYSYVNTPNIFVSEAILYAQGIPIHICKQTFDQYNQYLKKSDKIQLGKLINLNEVEIEQAISIEVFFGIDLSRDRVYDIIDYERTHNARDTTRREVPGYLFTRVKTTNAAFNNEFLKKIVENMNNDPYFLNLFNTKRLDDSLYMVSLRKEALSIDTIQRIQYKNPRTAKNTSSTSLIVMNEKEIKPLSSTILNFNRAANSIEAGFKIYQKPFTIIQNYSSIAVNEKSLKFPLFKWVFLLGVLVYIISLSLYYRQKIYATLQKAKNM